MRSIESSESSLPGNAPTVAWLETGLAIQISNFLVVLVVIVVVLVVVVVVDIKLFVVIVSYNKFSPSWASELLFCFNG